MKVYRVLLGPDPSSLGSQVNGLIKRGWEPEGGVAVTGIYQQGDGEHA